MNHDPPEPRPDRRLTLGRRAAEPPSEPALEAEARSADGDSEGQPDVAIELSPIEREIERAIAQEQRASRRCRRSHQVAVEACDLVTSLPDGLLYQLELSQRVPLRPEEPIRLIEKRPPNRTIEACVVDVQGFTIHVRTHTALDLKDASIDLRSDPSFLLDALKARLLEDGWVRADLATALLQDSIGPPSPPAAVAGTRLNERQELAIGRSLASPVHLVWGPPGTGKTRTMGEVVARRVSAFQSCLLLSTSNVAVDQLMAAAIQQRLDMLPDDEDVATIVDEFVRVGVPSDRELDPFTLENQSLRDDSGLREALGACTSRRVELQSALREFQREQVKTRDEKRLGDLAADVARTYMALRSCEEELAALRDRLHQSTSAVLRDRLCVATTLASLVVRRELWELDFDAVFVDETSMVSLLASLAAASRASRSVTFAGDPQQLPPIVRSDGREAWRWLGRNLYEHLGIKTPDDHPHVTFLSTQYRMQPEISNLVSTLSYDGQLAVGTSPDLKARVIALAVEPRAGSPGSYYSVSERSYYFPGTLMTIAGLMLVDTQIRDAPAMLISPFRAQEKLFARLVEDLRSDASGEEFRSSTIHRAQGDECDTVVLDLTIHDPATRHPFFHNARVAQQLINVALSRARTTLVVIFNPRLLDRLASTHPFYARFLSLISPHLSSAVDVATDIARALIEHVVTDDLASAFAHESGQTRGRSTYAGPSSGSALTSEDAALMLSRFASGGDSPLLVLREQEAVTTERRGIIYRRERERVTAAFATNGNLLALPLAGSWAVWRWPRVASALRTIAAGHLLEDGIEISERMDQLLCQRCGSGLELVKGDRALRLRCVGAACRWERRASRDDLHLLVRIEMITCDECGADMTPRRRRSDGSLFFGCQNYPSCGGTRAIENYAAKG